MDEDCSEDEYCDLGKCKTGCRDDEGCNINAPVCVDGDCIPGCRLVYKLFFWSFRQTLIQIWFVSAV